MENSMVERKPRFLGVFAIIRAAIEIPFINPSYIVYTFITSLPLFCVEILPKLSFMPSITRKAIVLLELPDSQSKKSLRSLPFINLSELTKFLAAVTVIDSASTIYKGGVGRSIGLRDLLRNSSIKTRWRNPIFAYIILSWFSNLSLVAVRLYGNAGPFSSLRNEWSPPLHFFTLLGFTFLRDEFSAWLQLALVVSVLEEDKLQLDAFLASWNLRRGNRFTGFVLMVLYFGWHCLLLVLKSFTSGVGYACVDRGLFSFGIIMNWVACTVYYHDCKNHKRREEVITREG